MEVDELAADHRHGLHFAGPDHAVHAFTDDIGRAVADAQRQRDVGVFVVKGGKRGNQQRGRERGRGIDPQMPARLVFLAAHGVVHGVQFGQQAGGLLVILHALGRCGNRARGAVHQLVAEMGLQVADQLADRGAGQVQLVGRAAERTGVDHADEGAHGQELVHV